MAARIAAFVAAAAMVVGAITLRDRMDHPNPASGTGTSSGALSLVCATELAQVCTTLQSGGVDVTVEPAATTADRLTKAESETAGVDGWLAPGPWPAMVDIARKAANRPTLFRTTLDRVARSPFVLVAPKDEIDKLMAGGCAAPIQWKCLGDAVNKSAFRLSGPDSRDATGLLAEAAFAGGLIGTTDYATNDLDDSAVTAWVTGLDRGIDGARRDGAASLNSLLILRAVANGFVTTEADGGPNLVNIPEKSRPQLVYLGPGATADVVLGSRPGRRGDDLRKLLSTDRAKSALQGGGWRVPGRAGAVGVDTRGTPLSADDGLPSAGVLEALEGIVNQ